MSQKLACPLYLELRAKKWPHKAASEAGQELGLLEVFCNGNQLQAAEGGEALLTINLELSKRRYDLRFKMSQQHEKDT